MPSLLSSGSAEYLGNGCFMSSPCLEDSGGPGKSPVMSASISSAGLLALGDGGDNMFW